MTMLQRCHILLLQRVRAVPFFLLFLFSQVAGVKAHATAMDRAYFLLFLLGEEEEEEEARKRQPPELMMVSAASRP